MANLGALSLILLYREEFCEVLTTSISVSFILFMYITMYHVYLELVRNEMFNVEQVVERLGTIRRQAFKPATPLPPNSDCHSTTSYVELRESLMQD